MPVFLVRLNGATIPLKGEIRKARTARTWRQWLPSPERLGRTAPLASFGLFDG